MKPLYLLLTTAAPVAAQDLANLHTQAQFPAPVAGPMFGSSGLCETFDCEGGVEFDSPGTVGSMTFGSGWAYLIDSDAGGSGNIANEPSGDGTVYANATPGAIDFASPISSFEVYYCASAAGLPMTITAYDGPGGTGSVLATVDGTVNGHNTGPSGCGGDPSGSWCSWSLTGLSTGSNNIASITISSNIVNQVVLDDFTICWEEPCTSIDFEGFGNFEPLTTIGTTPAVTFTNFVALIDGDAAGGTGNVANEPSGDTCCYMQVEPGILDFDIPVGHAEMWYVADQNYLPVTLRAWSGPGGTGTQVGMAMGNTIGRASQGAACAGDPTGDWCLWDFLSIDTGANNIRSITFDSPVANFVAFDDMMFCQVDELGSHYCQALPNSTGLTGVCHATGSTTVADNNFALHANQLPPNQFGMFVNSLTQGSIAVGSGNLCVVGAIGRHKNQIQTTGATGSMSINVDLTLLPTPSGPYAVLAGESWNFQCWHRDVGSTSNFTNAYNVLFQ